MVEVGVEVQCRWYMLMKEVTEPVAWSVAWSVA